MTEKELQILGFSKETIIELEIPHGVPDGSAMEMPGHGNAIKNGIDGDLLVIINEDYTHYGCNVCRKFFNTIFFNATNNGK